MEVPTVKLVNQMPVITALPSGQMLDNLEYGENGTVVVLDQEKKIRREIANSNERRRMQSINSGFQSLRTLLPHHEGEKLSKAAILQQTAEYIYSLEQEKTRLLAQNCHLKRLLSLSQQHHDQDAPTTGVSEAKRRKGKVEKMDTAETRVEGITDLALSQIEMIKEPEPIRINSGVVKSNTPAVTLVPPQTAADLPQQPVKNESSRSVPKKSQPEVTLPQAPISTTAAFSVATSAVTGLKTPVEQQQQQQQQQHCRRIVIAPPPATSNNIHKMISSSTSSSSSSTETMVVPIRPAASQTTIKVLRDREVEKVEESSGRSYVVAGSSTKQNLDSIVEAIKHLEGDHLFSSENAPTEVAQEEVVEYSLSDVVLPTVPVPVVQQQQQQLQQATGISNKKDTYIIFKN